MRRRLPVMLSGKEINLSNGKNSKWTDEQAISLFDLFKQGYSASMAAKALNTEYGTTFSRNAVISKLHRMGLTSKGGDGYREQRAKRMMLKAKLKAETRTRAEANKPKHLQFVDTWPLRRDPNKPRPKPDVPWRSNHIEVEVPEDKRKTLAELEDADCRWPIGDPQHKDFHFCCAERVPGRSYCSYHLNASYELKVDGVAAPYPLKGAQKKILEPA